MQLYDQYKLIVSLKTQFISILGPIKLLRKTSLLIFSEGQ